MRERNEAWPVGPDRQHGGYQPPLLLTPVSLDYSVRPLFQPDQGTLVADRYAPTSNGRVAISVVSVVYGKGDTNDEPRLLLKLCFSPIVLSMDVRSSCGALVSYSHMAKGPSRAPNVQRATKTN